MFGLVMVPSGLALLATRVRRRGSGPGDRLPAVEEPPVAWMWAPPATGGTPPADAFAPEREPARAPAPLRDFRPRRPARMVATTPGPARRAWGAHLGTYIAVVVAGLGSAAAVTYTVPGAPWNSTTTGDAGPAGTTGAARTSPRIGTGGTAMDPATNPATNPAMDPAMDMSAPTYTGYIRSSTHTVALDVTPAATGQNTVAVTVLDTNGVPARIGHWSATASLPGSDLADVPVALKPFGAGSAWANPDLTVAGRWTFTITVRVQDGGPQASFRQVVPIT